MGMDGEGNPRSLYPKSDFIRTSYGVPSHLQHESLSFFLHGSNVIPHCQDSAERIKLPERTDELGNPTGGVGYYGPVHERDKRRQMV
jgi:hypothetical protein